MRPGRVKICGTVVIAALAVGCRAPQDGTTPTPARSPAAADATVGPAVGPLVNTVWRITSPEGRPPGSFYLFLPNGTLVMTSCVETYRLATWRSETTDRLTIVEDTAVGYTADIQALSGDSLSLRLNLRSEQIDLTFEPARAPFVCPDLPR